MAQTDDQRRTSRAVSTWLAHQERNTAWLVRQTEADPGTIGDFLNGNRWPKFKTQGRIEKAIGWPAGTLTSIADGGDPPPLPSEAPDADAHSEKIVGGADQDAETENDLLYRRPEGLTDQEWERVKRESREYIEWQIERAARER